MLQSGAVLRLGRLMMASGAGAYRVKSSMARVASAVGLDRHEASVSLTEIVTSSYVGERFRTEAAEERRVGVNVDRLEALRRIVHDIKAHETVEELETKLDQVEKMKPLYGPFANAAASGVACAGFCFLNKGGWIECFAVLIAAFIGQYIRRFMLHRSYQHFFTWMVCGVVASSTYMAVISMLDYFGVISGNHQGGIISAILFLIPGFPMVTSMLDLARQDFSSAISRGAYVLTVMASAGIAVWSVTFMFGWDIEHIEATMPTGFTLYALRFICSFVAAYGFAMLFNAGKRAATMAALVGALANTGRLFIIDVFHVPWQMAVGLAAVAIGLLAQLFVSRVSQSRVALSVPAVVIMIPGVPFYRAISALNNHSVDVNVAVGQAAGNLAEVFFVITAIGVGLAMARIITDRNWRHDTATSVLPHLGD
ncbi:threonine/serine ThrE exporter family protein [Actinomyces vulturis]|uniref:threonine/serine ThrE exporter family protein n=1 Tax=Actinomyces vulturis TaxID=1857645 RepID=UPI0009F60861|nr:threonine/serine exporter family protein [Actinomyces vulturis]